MNLGQYHDHMKDSITLENTVGNKRIDQLLQGVVGVFERVFPNRIRGYYIIGSYANQTAVSTSDIDLCPLFKDAFLNDAECEKAWQIGWLCGDFISPVQVQAEPNDEKTLFSTPDTTTMKLASLLIYGEDIRPQLSLPSTEEYARDAMLQPIWFHYRIRKPDILTYPLEYPKLDDPYYGYVCRLEWAYKVPEKQKDQDHLRDIFKRVLAFENHFLGHYKIYVQQELEAISLNKRTTTPRFVRILSRIIFPDLKPQMENVLESLSQNKETELQQTALNTLIKLKSIT